MTYKILYGSLQYEPSITEDIFNTLLADMKSHGLKHYKHFSGGELSYDNYKRIKCLNIDPFGKKYLNGACYVIDNNPQNLPVITLDDLRIKENVINNYQIY